MVRKLKIPREEFIENAIELRKKGLDNGIIGRKYGITRQRVEQLISSHPLYKELGVKNIKGRRKETKCLCCGIEFLHLPCFTRKFCSRVCMGFATRKTKEQMKERKRIYAKKYYNEVLKKRPDWKKIISERNKKQQCKSRN
jgi:Ser-tRNA(Ala) deacylase AlaX